MTSPAHKTTPVNCTFFMRFWQSSSTGKELDSETGYGYHGARYMDYELLTCWLSVDPMADKYPNISPYHYCHWNPLTLFDPSGMEDMDDWYWNDETNAVVWREGHLNEVYINGDRYDNIGESFSQQLCDGEHINYYQNCPLTIGKERDAADLAYRDRSFRTSLIRADSPLPDLHKKDLFNTHIATRGEASPDMIGIDVGGSISLGVGLIGSMTIGIMRGEGFFMVANMGEACGVDISINIGMDAGYYLGHGNPSIESLNGLSNFESVGAGSLYVGYSSSVDSRHSWGVVSGGFSLGTNTLVGSASVGVYNSKVIGR